MFFYHSNGENVPRKQISNERLVTSSVGGMVGGTAAGATLLFTKTMGPWASASLGLVGCLIFCTATVCLLSTELPEKVQVNPETLPLNANSSPYEDIIIASTPEDGKPTFEHVRRP